MKHSSDFLFVAPNPSIGLYMLPVLPNEFSRVLILRLGLSVYEKTGTCPKCKQNCLDTAGQHALNCKNGGTVTIRHNKIRDILFENCRSALLNPAKEVQNLLDSTGVYPADILVPSYINSLPAAIDVTMRQP